MRLRAVGVVLLVVLSGILFVLPSASAATFSSEFLLPDADDSSSGTTPFADAFEGCSVDATIWNELDDTVMDRDETCRGENGGALNAPEVTLGVEPANPPGGTTGISVQIYFTVRSVAVRPFRLSYVLGTQELGGATNCVAESEDITVNVYTTFSRRYDVIPAACTNSGLPRAWVVADLLEGLWQLIFQCMNNQGGTGCVITQAFVYVQYTTGGGGGTPPDTPIVGGYGTFGNDFNLGYPDLSKTARQCANITIEDTRSEAALAILYLWNFGDGTQEQTTKGFVKHTYAKEGLYAVTVRVQYRSGAIEVLLINVNARGNQCIFNEFVSDFFPILLLLAGLMLLAAFIVQASKERFEKNLRKLLRRLFLLVALLAFGVMAIVVVYTTAMGIPI